MGDDLPAQDSKCIFYCLTAVSLKKKLERILPKQNHTFLIRIKPLFNVIDEVVSKYSSPVPFFIPVVFFGHSCGRDPSENYVHDNFISLLFYSNSFFIRNWSRN